MKTYLSRIALIFSSMFILLSCEEPISSSKSIVGKYGMTYLHPALFDDAPKSASFELLSDGTIQFFNVNLDAIVGFDWHQEKSLNLNGYVGRWTYDQKEEYINVTVENKNSSSPAEGKTFVTVKPWHAIGESGGGITILVISGDEITYSMFKKL